jgi:hypothetical protein
MGKKTGKIVYNVRERGRKFIGQDRNIDCRALAALVNGNEIQERVKNRDLRGFYGHILRMKFGFNPPETVIDKESGKVVNIEPAIVTTHLSADDDGNVTHEAEFLDTESGELAQRLFESKQGGFSSAIFAKPHAGIDVPIMFGGFDYVAEPNYTTNRGYMFDAVEGGGMDGLMLDAVLADWTMAQGAHRALYDSLVRDHELAMQSIQALREENEELMSILSRKPDAGGVVVLDGVDATRPLIVSKTASDALSRRVRSFERGTVVDFEAEPKDDPKEDAALRAAKQQYGV